MQRIAEIKFDDENVSTDMLYFPVKSQLTGRTHRLVIAASNRGKIRAYDADQIQSSNLQPLWIANIQASIPGAINDMGIASTPVIDSKNQLLYVVTRYGIGTSHHFALTSVDLTNGKVLAHTEISGIYSFFNKGDKKISLSIQTGRYSVQDWL